MVKPAQKFSQRSFASHSIHLHPSVSEVSDPSGQPETPGLLLRADAEENSLNAAFYERVQCCLGHRFASER
jgi:hypothetical protein